MIFKTSFSSGAIFIASTRNLQFNCSVTTHRGAVTFPRLIRLVIDINALVTADLFKNLTLIPAPVLVLTHMEVSNLKRYPNLGLPIALVDRSLFINLTNLVIKNCDPHLLTSLSTKFAMQNLKSLELERYDEEGDDGKVEVRIEEHLHTLVSYSLSHFCCSSALMIALTQLLAFASIESLSISSYPRQIFGVLLALTNFRNGVIPVPCLNSLQIKLYCSR